MKTCAEFANYFSEYLEGGAAEPLKSEMETHFQECANCRQEAGALREILSHLQGIGSVKAPAGFSARVQARLEKKPTWLEVLVQFKIPVTATAGLAVALAAGLLYYSMLPEKQPVLVQKETVSEEKPGFTLPAILGIEKDANKSVVGEIALEALGEKFVGKDMDQLPEIRLTTQDPAEAVASLKEWMGTIPESQLAQKDDHWIVCLPVVNYPQFLDELKKHGNFSPSTETPAFKYKFFQVDLYLLPKE